VLGEWKSAQYLTLNRNPNYWRRPVAIDRVVYSFIQEERAYVQAFRADQLDMISVSPEWWNNLRETPKDLQQFQYFRYCVPGDGYGFIAWNNTRPPFTDKRVRRAMTQLIWREQILKYILCDIGVVTTGPFWPHGRQADPTIKPWPYDREAAMKLLKEAGWEDRNGDGWLENEKGERFEFELSYPAGSQITRDFVRVVQEEFHRAGIDMSARAYTWAVFTIKLDTKDFDAARLGWIVGIDDDPYQVWHSSQTENQGSNFVSFKNAEVDRLIETARGTLDTDQRNELYHRLHRILHEEQPYTFLFSGESLRVFSKRIQGVRVHKLGVDWSEWWIDRSAAKEGADR